MRRRAAAFAGVALLAATTAFAGATRTYQVTGPVLEVKEDMVVAQKGKEKWAIAKDKDAKCHEFMICPVSTRLDGLFRHLGALPGDS